jgi:hypothetical protein
MASPRALARRNAVSANRTKDAADRIAGALGIEPLDVRSTVKGGAAYAQLAERESVTGYLERIAEAVEGSRAASVESKPTSRESRPKSGKGTAATVTEGENPDGIDGHDEALSELAGSE